MPVNLVQEVLAVVVTQVHMELARHTIYKVVSVLLGPLACVSRTQVGTVRSGEKTPLRISQQTPDAFQYRERRRHWILDRNAAGRRETAYPPNQVHPCFEYGIILPS